MYINQIIQLSTWTEAYQTTVYQNAYTLFYFTWWFAWAPFVSLFIARSSYGRSLKEFIVGVIEYVGIDAIDCDSFNTNETTYFVERYL